MFEEYRMEGLVIGRPVVKGSRIVCNIDAQRGLRRFFTTDEFWVEYDAPMDSSDASLLVIPAVAALAPVAWAAGRPVSVESIDGRFGRSFPLVYEAYRDLYPEIFAERIIPITWDESVRNERSGDDTALLFSGGVDSLTTYFKRQDERPTLYTVHGSDLDIEQTAGWRTIAEGVRSFAEAEGVAFHPIRSNFRSILRDEFLDHHFTQSIGREWFGAIQYGIALPALTAPAAYDAGISTVYLSSGYTRDPTYPTAQPSVVERLRWGTTSVEMTEVDMTRQDKLAFLAPHLSASTRPITVRSCYLDTTGKNCSSCEKCLRTMLGLWIEGIDPNDVGYTMNDATLERVRGDLEDGSISLDGYRLAFWKDLQQRVRQTEISATLHPFIDWFRNVDLEQLARAHTSTHESAKSDRLKSLLLKLPYPTDLYALRAARRVKRRFLA